MTIDRETVIGLAVEAGIKLGPAPDRIHLGTYVPDDISFSVLQRFATLVLEHERKPLTDEQRDQIYQEWASKSIDEVSYDDLMLAVEAAHGITNKESSDAE